MVYALHRPAATITNNSRKLFKFNNFLEYSISEILPRLFGNGSNHYAAIRKNSHGNSSLVINLDRPFT